MQVLVNVGVVLDVLTIKEALDKVDVVHSWGIVTALSANPRPQPVVGPQGPVGATHAQLLEAQARAAKAREQTKPAA